MSYLGLPALIKENTERYMFNTAYNSGASNSYINVQDSALLRISSEITIESWVKVLSHVGNWDSVGGKRGSSEGRTYSLIQYVSANAIMGEIATDDDGQIGRPSTGNGSVSLNTWYHVAVTYDGALCKIYLNGEFKSQTPLTGNIITGSSDFRIGHQGGSGSNRGHIQVREFRLWNIARSDNDIRNYLYRSVSAQTSGLVLYFKFKEQTGTTVNDHSGNGNHGTLFNCSWERTFIK